MGSRLLTLAIKQHEDVVAVRRRARQLAGLLGFPEQDQTRIATAVSEIARNAQRYATGGRVEFEVEGQSVPQVLIVRVRDEGPGIPDLSRILAGQYRSQTGMGLGLVGAKRLVDQMDIDTVPGRGTTVVLKKIFARKAPLITPTGRLEIADALAREPPQNALDELQQQNRELLSALDELTKRQEELSELNRELEDTNRGVVALYAELDEQADHLRRADAMKSRFLSNMSHEFRTPLHSILALTKLLAQRMDGDLSPEQERQVNYVQRAAESLLELVNDLLDIAKIEAGKIEVKPIEFEVTTFFSALRGMLRPLLVSDRVQLIFDDAAGLPPLYTDESKVSQVLRNFISNALKFTERGEVRVAAKLNAQGDAVVFSVADTGIGIAPDDQAMIFEEFVQLENPLQRNVKGTGLGLPLSRRLAGLLGGSVGVESTPGVGSIFFATLPLHYPGAQDLEFAPPEIPEQVDSGRLPVLIVDDQPELLLIYERYLRGSRFEPIPVRNLRQARAAIARHAPRAILLDILLRGEETWSWLAQLKANAETKSIPVLVATTVEDQRKGLALGADAYVLKPVDRVTLLAHLHRLVGGADRGGLLIVDDEEASRYVLRKLVGSSWSAVHEASDGEEGLRLARELHPRGIVLDLQLPGLSGEAVLEALHADPATNEIPVVVVTSQVPAAQLRGKLLRHARAVLSKQQLSAESLLQSLQT